MMYQCDTLCCYGLWCWWYIHWIEAIKELCNVVCTYVTLYSYGLQKWGYQRMMDLPILVSVILNHIQIFEWIVETYTRLTLLFCSVENNPKTPQITGPVQVQWSNSQKTTHLSDYVRSIPQKIRKGPPNLRGTFTQVSQPWVKYMSFTHIILLMEEIPHQLIWRNYHYLQGFYTSQVVQDFFHHQYQ